MNSQNIIINIIEAPLNPDNPLNPLNPAGNGIATTGINLGFVFLALFCIGTIIGILLYKKQKLSTLPAKIGLIAFLIFSLVGTAVSFGVTGNTSAAHAEEVPEPAIEFLDDIDTIEIEQGTTEKTVTFDASISNITDGFSLGVNLDSESNLNGASVKLEGMDVVDTEDVWVWNEKVTAEDPETITMQLKITVPAQAELGEFGTIKLNYKVNDYLLSLNDIQTAMNDETADSLIKMQQLTTDICQTATYVDNDPEENTITLTDIRDSNTYLVRKLMDDKCWMVQNLRISNADISAEDTDINTDTYNPMTHIPAIDNVTSFTAGNKYIPLIADPASVLSGYCYNRKGSPQDCGLHYDWTAAVASTDSQNLDHGGTVAPNSICPKNWHLPTGGDAGEFAELDRAMDGTGAIAQSAGDLARWTNEYQFAGIFSGTRYLTSFANVGERGYYWSSTASGNSLAKDLSLINVISQVSPGTNQLSFNNGNSVRCVVN